MIKMKILDYQTLLKLNESSIRAGRKQNLLPEQIPNEPRGRYMVNFRFDHEWAGQRDTRMSVVLKPGAQSVWLDVSPEEFAAVPQIEVSELEWEAAVCVGIPRWAP